MYSLFPPNNSSTNFHETRFKFDKLNNMGGDSSKLTIFFFFPETNEFSVNPSHPSEVNLNYYYNGLILPLYPVLCCFKRDFYSVSTGSRDISVLLSLFQILFIYLFFFFVSFPSSFLLLSSLTTVVAKYCYTVNFCS